MNQKMLMATAQPSIVSSMSLVRGFGRPETRGLVFIDEQHTLTPHLVEFRQVVVISIEGMDALVVRHPVGYGQQLTPLRGAVWVGVVAPLFPLFADEFRVKPVGKLTAAADA